MDQKIGEQIIEDAHLMGDTASNVVADLGRRYHEFVEDIEAQKLLLQKKIVERKKLDKEIEEDRKRIDDLEALIKYSKGRVNDPEYISDLQRIIDRLIANPRDQAHIPEMARTLAQKHQYYLPLIIKDINDAISKSNGQYKYKNGRKETGLAEVYS